MHDIMVIPKFMMKFYLLKMMIKLFFLIELIRFFKQQHKNKNKNKNKIIIINKK